MCRLPVARSLNGWKARFFQASRFSARPEINLSFDTFAAGQNLLSGFFFLGVQWANNFQTIEMISIVSMS